MSRPSLLEAGKSYSFRSYFEMPYEVDDILAEFGIGFKAEKLQLPNEAASESVVEPLKRELESRLRRVRLSSETARREVLVSPVLFSVAELSDSQIRIEYPLIVSEQLKGKLDYLVRGKRNLLVVEAKNDDITRGFTQLSVELIALARKEDIQGRLYGAVTIGNAWLFGCLDTIEKEVIQDTDLYPVPNSLEAVMSILLGVLKTH
ncbi:MAG: hypothetical protein AAF004_11860 [Pseudomonadota bacterium]